MDSVNISHNIDEVRRIYQELWSRSVKQFQQGNYELDPLINSSQDTRRGLTLLSRVTGDVSRNIQRFLEELQSLESYQYCYPASDFHVTVMSVVSCYEGLRFEDVERNGYLETIANSIVRVEPFSIEFTGITASPSCILIQGLPKDNQLNRLRDKLRSSFNQSTLTTSIDARYRIATAHCTVVRFQNPVKNSDKLIELLQRYREYKFGTLKVDNLEFVFNDWYQKKRNTEVLGRIRLSGTK